MNPLINLTVKLSDAHGPFYPSILQETQDGLLLKMDNPGVFNSLL
jgi:hypothetical protein